MPLALEADLEQWESTEQAFAARVRQYSRLDVVINNIREDDHRRSHVLRRNISRIQIEKEIRRSLFPDAVGLPRGIP